MTTRYTRQHLQKMAIEQVQAECNRYPKGSAKRTGIKLHNWAVYFGTSTEECLGVEIRTCSGIIQRNVSI